MFIYQAPDCLNMSLYLRVFFMLVIIVSDTSGRVLYGTYFAFVHYIYFISLVRAESFKIPWGGRLYFLKAVKESMTPPLS